LPVSFATNQYKAGIPSITIMAITGHNKEVGNGGNGY